jgi:glycosyltransferase involved in cell wall biosynthesis
VLVIISTHPIQYQVPLWQAIARDGRVPFEVWYMTHHAATLSRDREFGKDFAWDIDMLQGYPSRLLPVVADAAPTSFLGCRFAEPLAPMLAKAGARAVWIQGWQVLGYWQAALHAKRAGCELWLRGESNNLAPIAWWKRPIKRLALGWLFSRVDRFLCVGESNARLYRAYRVPDWRLSRAPYAVDNERFRAQAERLRPNRGRLRSEWGIADDAFCVLFCGKFVPKKRPFTLVEAANRVGPTAAPLHLLFAGSGELGDELRRSCQVVFDAEAGGMQRGDAVGPRATFAGFLNQTEISRAYVAADCLLLPSDFGETWGLVANEAMASGLPCIISDRCGCAADLGGLAANQVFPFGNVAAMCQAISRLQAVENASEGQFAALQNYAFSLTVESVEKLYSLETAAS